VLGAALVGMLAAPAAAVAANPAGPGGVNFVRKAKFSKRIDVGSATGKYRVRTKFKGNARYFPARSRFKDCSY
jgi:hypothetical protein